VRVKTEEGAGHFVGSWKRKKGREGLAREKRVREEGKGRDDVVVGGGDLFQDAAEGIDPGAV
jgi:hypothetical protein